MSSEASFSPDDNGIAADGIFGLPHGIDAARLVIVTAPWEVTVTGARGTAHAPDSIIEQSREIDLYFHPDGAPWQAGIAVDNAPEEFHKNLKLRTITEEMYLQYQRGTLQDDETVRWIDEQSRAFLDRLRRRISRHHAAGKLTAILGGEHTVALAGIEAAVQEHGDAPGILQIDAHADLRERYLGLRYSHATVFRRALEAFPQLTLVSVGLRDIALGEKAWMDATPRIHAHMAAQLAEDLANGKPWQTLVEDIIAPLPRKVYVSFDIDGLDLQYCPHTGTPVPGGLSFWQSMALVRAVVQSGRRIVGFDLSEVGHHPQDARTGAFVLFHLCNHLLLSNMEK